MLYVMDIVVTLSYSQYVTKLLHLLCIRVEKKLTVCLCSKALYKLGIKRCDDGQSCPVYTDFISLLPDSDKVDRDVALLQQRHDRIGIISFVTIAIADDD